MKKYILFWVLIFSLSVSAQLVTHPGGVRIGIAPNDDYTVRVREPGGQWQNLFEYNVQVDMDRVQDATMVQFDMGKGPVEVMVKKNNGKIYDVDIRPLKNNIAYTQVGNSILFTLDKPQYLSVEFNGDRLNNLHLFANPLETETYTDEADGVMYFGRGVHQGFEDNTIKIPSNTTVYLAPGAIVKAKLLVINAENVRIIGRGLLINRNVASRLPIRRTY